MSVMLDQTPENIPPKLPAGYSKASKKMQDAAPTRDVDECCLALQRSQPVRRLDRGLEVRAEAGLEHVHGLLGEVLDVAAITALFPDPR
jgi:hypothetical protein